MSEQIDERVMNRVDLAVGEAKAMSREELEKHYVASQALMVTLSPYQMQKAFLYIDGRLAGMSREELMSAKG